MAGTVPTSGGDPKARELREWFTYADNEQNDNRKEGQTDMTFLAGDPWDKMERRAREKAKRPVLTFDEIGQYINQVVNDVRENPVAVKFSPVGNGANDDTARWYGNKMREVEYRSNAQVAYTTAFENAVSRGYGYVRVTTRYEHERSNNQEVWVEPLHNPDLVTPDPDALMPDLSDQRKCIIRDSYTHDAFKRRWKNAKIRDFGRDVVRQSQGWATRERVFVAEAWEIDTISKKLLTIQPADGGDPVGIFREELPDEWKMPDGAMLLSERDSDVPRVKQYITNGLEILHEQEWAGKYIPVAGCFGKVLYVPDGAGGSKRVLMSMVRLARDPYMLYCYYRTCEAELVGMTPKFPWFVYEGQLAPDQLVLLKKSNKEPVTVIQIKPTFPGAPVNTIMGPPVRNPYEPPIQALEIGAESARRAIQAAMGWTPLPTDAQRNNQKSGVALRRIESSGQRGSFHFKDHYLGMVRQVGVICEDLFAKIYDTKRKVGVRLPNDTSEITVINDANDQKSISTKGEHLVTVSTGPSAETEREAASDFADTLAGISPEVFGLLGPLIVKLKNLGPIGDEMAELLEAMQPPQVQAMRQAKAKDGGDPKQAAQQAAMAMAENAKLKEALQKLQQALDTDAAKQSATIKTKEMDLAFQREKLAVESETKITVAELGAKVERLALFVEERARLGVQQHEAMMSALGHRQTLEQGAIDAEYSRQSTDQQHQNALAQGAQSAQAASDLAAQNAAQQPTEGA